MDMAAVLFLVGSLSTVMLGGLVILQVSAMRRRRQILRLLQAAEVSVVNDVVTRASLLPHGNILAGRVGSHRVRIQERQREDAVLVRIIVEGDSAITLRPETMATAMEKRLGVREIELGDAQFDSDVYVNGPEDVVRALLDAKTRRSVREMLLIDVSVLEGDVVSDLRVDLIGEPDLLTGRLERLVEIARLLERPTSLVKRIVENTSSEPEWRVRLGNLQLLASVYPHHPATSEALARGCHDDNRAVRLACALALGAEKSEATLSEIAMSEGVDDLDAARATAALGLRLSPAKLLAILAYSLRTRRHETARASIDVLGQFGGPEVVALLAKVLALEKGELAAAAARALGASRSSAAEGPLLRALNGPSSDVQIAVAGALGQGGTAAAVLPLKDVAERTGEAPLRKAAREAIAEIQSRLGGASPGQLSLAEGDAGQLSLADEDPHGRVSIAEPRGASSVRKPT